MQILPGNKDQLSCQSKRGVKQVCPKRNSKHHCINQTNPVSFRLYQTGGNKQPTDRYSNHKTGTVIQAVLLQATHLKEQVLIPGCCMTSIQTLI